MTPDDEDAAPTRGRPRDPSDLPRPDELRRFTVYGTTEENPEGEVLAVGVEFPEGAVLAALAVPTGPVAFTDMEELRSTARSLADGPGGDVWVSYEDHDPRPAV